MARRARCAEPAGLRCPAACRRGRRTRGRRAGRGGRRDRAVLSSAPGPQGGRQLGRHPHQLEPAASRRPARRRGPQAGRAQRGRPADQLRLRALLLPSRPRGRPDVPAAVARTGRRLQRGTGRGARGRPAARRRGPPGGTAGGGAAHDVPSGPLPAARPAPAVRGLPSPHGGRGGEVARRAVPPAALAAGDRRPRGPLVRAGLRHARAGPRPAGRPRRP